MGKKIVICHLRSVTYIGGLIKFKKGVLIRYDNLINKQLFFPHGIPLSVLLIISWN